jgi:hypothetical protein
MQYVLLIYGNEQAWGSRTEQEQQENHERHVKFMAMLQERGAARGGAELEAASTATTVRNTGAVGITDGPYAETAEQIGGYYVIEAADLDEAIAIARQLPEPIVEVRALVEHPDMAN